MLLGTTQQTIVRGGKLALMERCLRVSQQRFRGTRRSGETEGVTLGVGYGGLWWECVQAAVRS